MRPLLSLYARFAALFRRRSTERAMSAELQAHIEALTARHILRGMTPDEARNAALREFGGVEQIKERCRDERQRGFIWLEQTAQDIRYASRHLMRARSFSVAAILTIAIGIGACTALFSIVYGVLLRPLDFPQSERLVTLGETRQNGTMVVPVAPGEYFDWSKASCLEALTVFTGWGYNATFNGHTVEISGQRVTATYFDVLGVQPMLGRPFSAAEAEPGRGDVVVLSYQFWQQSFGGDPKVINQTIRLDGHPFTIVGVMPDVKLLGRPAIFTPLTFTAADRADYGTHGLACLGRLKPGISRQRAQLEMDKVATDIARAHPASNKGRGVRVGSLLADMTGDVRLQLFVLLGAVLALLLIACVNVANLTLVRTSARELEIATRHALGATRGRITRQLLTESLVLSAIGGTLGLLTAYASMGALLRFAGPFVPRIDEIAIDLPVLVASFLIVALAGVAIGLLPALEAAPRRGAGLRLAGGKATSSRTTRLFRSGLVVVEIALALLLLTGTGLLARSLSALRQANQGFNPANVGFDRFSLTGSHLDSGAKQNAFEEQLLTRVQQCPGVTAAALSNGMPGGGVMGLFISVGGAPTVPVNELPITDAYVVTPEYFSTLQIPLLQGRGFTPMDRTGAPRVVIINETLARRFFPNTNPIGQRLMILTMDDKPDVMREIVGIVGDVKPQGPESDVRSQVYEPLAQRPTGFLTLLVRAGGSGAAVRASVQDIFRRLDPELPAQVLQPYENFIANGWFRQRFSTTVFLLFSCIALLLAGVGTYGVVAYTATRRTREIGIRIALGARMHDIRQLVFRNAVKLIFAGIALGCVAAIASTRVLRSLLFAVSPYDPVTLTSASALLALIAFVACWLPARRATKVDPVTALRAQ